MSLLAEQSKRGNPNEGFPLVPPYYFNRLRATNGRPFFYFTMSSVWIINQNVEPTPTVLSTPNA